MHLTNRPLRSFCTLFGVSTTFLSKVSMREYQKNGRGQKRAWSAERKLVHRPQSFQIVWSTRSCNQIAFNKKSNGSDIGPVLFDLRESSITSSITGVFKAVKTGIFVRSPRTWNPRRFCTGRFNRYVKRVR